MQVIATATAWDCIGFDDGKFRIKGGKALYEAVMYNVHNEGRKVKLARLDVSRGVREVARWVDPDTVLEFVSIHTKIKDLPYPLCEKLKGAEKYVKEEKGF